jgi:3-methylcrotonyl-CoA carboxylase alpha subunit
MFTTLLIANRGEIACRIAATARRMGIKTIAVYSQADQDAAHVSACDEAFQLGDDGPIQAYLNIHRIIEIAKQTGAQAIHPGYGFLSENADFAAACQANQIIFVGPPASAIAAMGSKSAAKTLMQQAGVPLVPGYHGDNQDPIFLQQQANAIGYPVLIKASAGGGGKGMRIVNSSDEFADSLASCQREAAKAFNDSQVLIERYLLKPRHIEIQLFADQLGQCVYLNERDCSIQRRHQKVVEEAPAPGISDATRAAMGQAAVAAAKAVGYVGAGTVEFIVDASGTFYFMEMNTRLQVEHPITEMITGLDLVQWQLMIANQQPLPLTQTDVQRNGHAFEVRIYAENTEQDFLPSTGQLVHLKLPEAIAFSVSQTGPNHSTALYAAPPTLVRIDSGVRSGDEITSNYDPMIAKLITWGPNREAARAQMLTALSRSELVGVHNNIEFLQRVFADHAFIDCDVDTGFIDRRKSELTVPNDEVNPHLMAAALSGVLAYRLNTLDASKLDTNTPLPNSALRWNDPWLSLHYWRNTLPAQYTIELLHKSRTYACEVTEQAHQRRWQCTNIAQSRPLAWQVEQKYSPCAYALEVQDGDYRFNATLVFDANTIHVFSKQGRARFEWYNPLLQHEGGAHTEHIQNGLTAPMPGKVIAVYTNAKAQVHIGQALITIEAMKMEHTIKATRDGIVKTVVYQVGDQVKEGDALIILEEPV